MKGTKRRNNMDIEADILRLLLDHGGALKTQIVYGANLNFKIVKGYLESLLRRGFMEFDGIQYIPTDRARVYLAAYEALSAL